MRVEKAAEPLVKPDEKVPQPIAKIVTLVVLAVSSGSLFWWSVGQLLHLNLDLSRVASTLLPPVLFLVFALSVFLGVAGFCFMLLANPIARIAAALLVGAAYFVFFPVGAFGLIAAAASAFAVWTWAQAVQGDVKNRQKFTIAGSTRAGIGFALFILLLAVALTYYASLTRGDARSEAFKDNLTRGAVGLMNQFLGKQFNGYRPEMTLDEFIVNFGAKGLEDSFGNIIGEQKERVDNQAKELKHAPAPEGLPPEFQKLFKDYQNKAPGEIIPQSAIDEALKKAEGQIVSQLRQQLLNGLGIEALGTDTMDSVLTKFIDRRVDEMLGRYIHFLPIILAASVYFLLQIFSVLYLALARGVSLVLYFAFRLMKFVRVETVQIPAERLRL